MLKIVIGLFLGILLTFSLFSNNTFAEPKTAELKTHSGMVSLKSTVLRFGQPVTIILQDPDLNVKPNTVDIYTVINDPTSPNVDTVGTTSNEILLEVLIKNIRFKRCMVNGVEYGGLAASGFRLIETGPDTGRFEGVFKMPSQICNADGTKLTSPAGGTVDLKYYDSRDSSGQKNVFGLSKTSTDSKSTKSTNDKQSKTTKSEPQKPIKPRVKIIGVLKGSMPNQYIVGFDVCAGSDRLEKPQLQIVTDIQEFKPITFPAIIGSKSCKFNDYTVKAEDPTSIKIDFYKTGDSEKIEQLEKELAELKKLIKQSTSKSK